MEATDRFRALWEREGVTSVVYMVSCGHLPHQRLQGGAVTELRPVELGATAPTSHTWKHYVIGTIGQVGLGAYP